jgi:hypothetical protein
VVERSPEKAGVGGSTPSLATIIPKDLIEVRFLTPVRSQSAILEGSEGKLSSWLVPKGF